MKVRESVVVEIVRTVVTTIAATGGACWAARGALADNDRRISIVESHQQLQDKNFADALAEIHLDLRDMRNAMLDSKQIAR